MKIYSACQQLSSSLWLQTNVPWAADVKFFFFTLVQETLPQSASNSFLRLPYSGLKIFLKGKNKKKTKETKGCLIYKIRHGMNTSM